METCDLHPDIKNWRDRTIFPDIMNNTQKAKVTKARLNENKLQSGSMNFSSGDSNDFNSILTTSNTQLQGRSG